MIIALFKQLNKVIIKKHYRIDHNIYHSHIYPNDNNSKTFRNDKLKNCLKNIYIAIITIFRNVHSHREIRQKQ